MKKTLVLMFIVLVMMTPVWLAAQEVSSGLRFGHAPEEVMSIYTRLTDTHAEDTYATLSGSMRRDLWSLHLSRALVELPELTLEQRAVILQGLGLLSRGVLGVDPDDPEWEMRFGESMRYLERQARELLPPGVRIAVFARLGTDVTMAGNAVSGCSEATSLDKMILRCTCSTESDFCDLITNPDPDCEKPTDAACLPKEGCGLFWQYTCDGHCS